METTDHAPVSSDSLCGPTMTADEPSTSAYPYDLARSEESESDIRPFFEISTEEKRLVRKLDARILPIVCLLYLFACKSHLSPCMRVLITYVSMQIWTGRILAMRACKVYRRMLSEATRQEIYSTGSTLHFSFHM